MNPEPFAYYLRRTFANTARTDTGATILTDPGCGMSFDSGAFSVYTGNNGLRQEAGSGT